jgi:hypothetical protein
MARRDQLIKKLEFEVYKTDDNKVILKRILPGRNESKEKLQKELALPKMRVHVFTETRYQDLLDKVDKPSATKEKTLIRRISKFRIMGMKKEDI